MPVLVACALGMAIGLVFLWRSARTAITIAVAEIDDGNLRVARGGLSPRVVGDLGDIVARPRIRRATIRILRSKDRAIVEVHGAISPHQMQQIRNVIGTSPLSKIVRAHRR